MDIEAVVAEVIRRLKADPSFRGPAGKDGTDGKDAEISNQQLAAITSAILQRIQDDPTFRGPPGPPGRDVDVEALRSDILSSLPKIRVQINDAEPVEQDLSKGDSLFRFRIDNRFGVRSGDQ